MLPPLAAFLLGAVLAAPIPQGEPAPERVYLVQDVLLWSPAGGEAERGTLLIQDGHVTWSASDLDAADYPEARIIEAEEDWLVYPGRVNAAFPGSFGELPANPYVSESSDVAMMYMTAGGRTAPVPAMELGSRTAFRGWMHAADYLAWDAAVGGDWRGDGFTSGYVFGSEGLVQGHASWIALNDRPLGDALLLREGLTSYSLRAGRGGYPSTPMAALATHRQLQYDAGAAGAYAAPDIQLPRQRVFRADGEREIENVLDLHEGQDVELLILGGGEAWKLAERLKERDVAVLYVLSLPDAPDAPDEDADASQRKYWEDPAALLEERRLEHQQKVSDFLKLRESGVRCALVPGGSAREFRDDLGQLLEAGANEEDLRVATISDPRTLLGLEHPAADFVISRGALDLKKPDLAWIFVQDRAWELKAGEEAAPPRRGRGGAGGRGAGGRRGGGQFPPGQFAPGQFAPGQQQPGQGPGQRRFPGQGPGQAGAQAPEGIDGEWQMTVESPMGEFHFSIAVDSAAGTVELFEAEKPDDRSPATDVTLDGERLEFTFVNPEMQVPMTARMQLRGRRISGELETPFGEVPISGRRADGGGAEEPAEEGKDKFGNALGHPAYPVESEADRLPPSEWARDRAGSLLLRGGTLYTVAGDAPAVGNLLIVDGVIEAVGGDIEAPAGVPVVDASGWHVMPGVIDAHSHLALDSINEGTMSITCECQIADMIHPGELGIWRATAGGTTLVQSLHGSANPIGGQAAVWELDYWDPTIADLLLPGAKQGVKFALGENVKRSGGGGFRGGGGGRFPATRMGVEAVFRRAFQDALAYKEQRRLHEAGRMPGFRRDVRLETLAGILDNEIHVQCHSYRADEIYMMLRVCEEFGIQAPTFQHVLEGYKVAPELAAYGAMASTFSDWWAYKYEVKDAIPWNVEILHKAGVTVSINSDSDEMIRRLNSEAGKSLRYGGLSYQDAMATTTLNSAKQLRLDDRLGSLEVGKLGSVTVYDAPPLSSYARCLLTVARGIVLYEANPAHEQRWQDYAAATAAFATTLREAPPASEAEAEVEMLEESSEEVAETAEEEHADTAAEEPVVLQELFTPAAIEPDADADAWERWTRAGRGKAYLIENAIVHPISSEPFLGAVFVKDGRIVAVGPQVEPDVPCEIVDAGGKHLYPGFLDADDTTGLYEIGQVSVSVDQSEIGNYNPDLSAAAAVHADSAHHHVTRLTGIAYVLVSPQSGTIRGQSALVQLEGTTTDDLIAVRDLGLHINFPRVSGFEAADGPETPDGIAELDRWFDDAIAWGERVERMAAAGRLSGERQPQWEALLPYARGEKPVFLECSSAAQLMMARDWAQRRGLDAVYVGADEAWQVAGYLGAEGARVIVGPIHALPRGANTPFDTPFRLPWLLAEAGCRVALRTNDPEQTRNLPFQAATAAAWGLDRDRTLHALTLGAAEVLGVDGFVGSIEPGKVASFFLAEGDPLDFTGRIERMWIGGGEIPLESKQTRLRERYLERLGPGGNRVAEVE